MDIQSMRKLFSITTVLQIILIGGCSNQSESNDIDIVDKMPGSNVVEVMLIDNIDTDQIIPSREMKKVSKLGLGEGLLRGGAIAMTICRRPGCAKTLC